MLESKEDPIERQTNQSVSYSCCALQELSDNNNHSFVPNLSHDFKDPKWHRMNWTDSGLSGHLWFSLPLSHFNALGEDLIHRSVSTNELLASIEKQIIYCNNKSTEVLQTSYEKLDNYLKLRETHFLNKLKNTENKVDHKLDSLATDLKTILQTLQTTENLIRNSDTKFEQMRDKFETNDRNLQKCIKTLASIDSKLRNKWMSNQSLSDFLPIHWSKDRNKDSNQLNPFCEKIANKLGETIKSIINHSFTDFKKTIVEQKLMEMIGDDNGYKSKTYSESKKSKDNSNEDSDGWLSSFLLRNGQTDQKTLRIKALDLLNASKIVESFSIALSLRKPDFVCHLLSAFQSSPQKLFEKLKAFPKLCIDLLDQMISDGVFEPNKRWKIPLIAGLILRIDMKCPITRSSVPRLADYWSNVMSRVAEMGGQHSETAKLLAISLKHISTEFY